MKRLRSIFLNTILVIVCLIGFAGCNKTMDKEGDFTESFQGGNGTEESPYEIGSAEDMLRLSEIVNANSTKLNTEQSNACKSFLSAHYVLTADIDLKNKAWTPIGDGYLDSVTSFAGVFDGNGHTIRGLSVNI